MENSKVLKYIQDVLENMPADWLRLTTHRLDIYNEQLAKTQFLEQFEALFEARNAETATLSALPTAFDYIRLGHPLSSILEWAIASLHNLKPENVISFSSRTMPVLAVLRKNLLTHKNTQIVYTGELPAYFDAEVLERVYGYTFDLKRVEKAEDVPAFDGSTVFFSQEAEVGQATLTPQIDFYVSMHVDLGSVLLVNGKQNNGYVSEIQHVRRRESIAMTPANSFAALQQLIGKYTSGKEHRDAAANKAQVLDLLKSITGTNADALVGSSGLSMQYAIMMGLVHDALEKHPEKPSSLLFRQIAMAAPTTRQGA
ncbi:hypothetical protein GCM10028895_46520 [Pontibacter rugosus]